VLGRPPDGADVAVVADVHRLSLEDVAAALQSVPDGRRVVVAGDDAVLPAAAPGAVLHDLVTWGRLPVHDLRDDPAGADALGRLPAALRQGELPEPDAEDRSVVVVPCVSDEDVVRRAVQVVRDSVPRVFGVAPSDVLVVAPLRRGAAGASALDVALAKAAPGVRVATVHDAAAAAQASGALTRPMLATCATLAERHLSVVTAAGDALPRAVRDGVSRPRRTRLLHLIRTASSAAMVGHDGVR